MLYGILVLQKKLTAWFEPKLASWWY
jgi:hypothetical protein